MRLADYLQQTGISTVKLAKSVGISRTTLTKIRDGASCQTRILDKLAQVTGLSREELLPPLPTRRRSRSATAQNIAR